MKLNGMKHCIDEGEIDTRFMLAAMTSNEKVQLICDAAHSIKNWSDIVALNKRLGLQDDDDD